MVGVLFAVGALGVCFIGAGKGGVGVVGADGTDCVVVAGGFDVAELLAVAAADRFFLVLCYNYGAAGDEDFLSEELICYLGGGAN